VSKFDKILVIGGAGYVGSALVPKLLAYGYGVKVLDLFIYGREVFAPFRCPRLSEVAGDIRDEKFLRKEIPGSDAIIHLACISNDPSYELDSVFGKSVNYDSFIPLVGIAKKSGVSRFIYASSSSVYGIKEMSTTEDMPLDPLTDYSKYKAMCEEVLLSEANDDFIVTVVRPATVSGYSPRLRLDLTVNLLTNHAISSRSITVFGGDQKRGNLHIEDMTDLYLLLLEQPGHKIHKKIYNVGNENLSVREIAEIIAKLLGDDISIVTTPTNDTRSYHICSERIKRDLGFEANRTIGKAVLDLKEAFEAGRVTDSMNDIKYYNIKTMKRFLQKEKI